MSWADDFDLRREQAEDVRRDTLSPSELEEEARKLAESERDRGSTIGARIVRGA